MRLYRSISLSLAVIFALVGLIFLFIPGSVLSFFNYLSTYLGMPVSPVRSVNFYLILAVGYMYVVTWLAYFMYRYPTDPRFPLLLANAKLASSLLSFLLFWTQPPYLIYVTNGVIDGSIGVLALVFYGKIKRAAA